MKKTPLVLIFSGDDHELGGLIGGSRQGQLNPLPIKVIA
jgi:hypothetical protein